MMTRAFLAGLALLLAVVLPAPWAAGADVAPVLAQIDALARLGEDDDPLPLLDAITDAVAADPHSFVAPLLKRIADGGLPDKTLALHVWALGLTDDPAVVDPLIALYRGTSSTTVQRSCLQALATIGGPRASQLLMAALEGTSDPDLRFEILALLGQVQEEGALVPAGELLARDPGRYSWQSVFVFGKMGDKAVPFLLSKIADKDRYIRMNSIHVLGMWLLAPEAATALMGAYWTEADAEVRELMLRAVQLTITNLGELRRFLGQVIAREADQKLVAFARQTLEGLGEVSAEAEQFARQTGQPTRPFEDVWQELYRSAGRKGDYGALAAASRAEHEARLKALRERILQRPSEEALSDYQTVNRIILRNRLAAAIAKN